MSKKKIEHVLFDCDNRIRPSMPLGSLNKQSKTKSKPSRKENKSK